MIAVLQTGQFGANMQVHLVNAGPVTILLRRAPSVGRAQNNIFNSY